ncbi:MAG: hypothetical protein ACRD8U_24870 [Pyrinomonadaceae bacterium]
MNCHRFESIASDLAREQIIDATLRDEALAHYRECENCTVTLQDQQSLTLALQTLADQMRFVEASPGAEANLMATFRAGRRQSGLRRTTQRWSYPAVVAAAVFLIIVGIATWRAFFTTAPNPRSQNDTGAVNTGQRTPTVATVSESAAVKKPQAAVSNADHRVRFRKAPGDRNTPNRSKGNLARQSVASNGASAGHEIATEFLPLRYQNTLNFQDGGRIVRVELPRSAMVSFGFPVNIERANEKVKADVLFGVDGLAQAIRFVQ